MHCTHVVGDDFKSLDAIRLTFNYSQSDFLIPLELINDDIFELTKVVNITLNFTLPLPSRIFSGATYALVTVIDDDG